MKKYNFFEVLDIIYGGGIILLHIASKELMRDGNPQKTLIFKKEVL